MKHDKLILDFLQNSICMPKFSFLTSLISKVSGKKCCSAMMLMLCLPGFLTAEWFNFDDWKVGFDERVSWNFEGELLVFKPNLENLSYAKEYTLNDVGILSSLPAGLPFYDLYSGQTSESEKKVNFNYSAGFRGTIGAKFNNYELEAALIWTTLHSTASHSLKAEMSDLFNGTLIKGQSPIINFGTAIGEPNAFILPPVSAAAYKYSLQFNGGDLFFFKKLSLCRNIVIEPTIGFSGVIINQKFRTTFTQNQLGTTPFPIIAMDILHQQDLRFQGIGGKAGVTSHWFLNPSLNIFGSLFGALYFGDFNVKEVAIEIADLSLTGVPPPGIPEANLVLNNHNRFQDVRFAGTCSLGIEYGVSFNCDRNIIIGRFSWEGHWFPSQNMLSVYSTTGSIENVLDNADLARINNSVKANIIGGDLSLSGWVLSLFVGF